MLNSRRSDLPNTRAPHCAAGVVDETRRQRLVAPPHSLRQRKGRC